MHMEYTHKPATDLQAFSVKCQDIGYPKLIADLLVKGRQVFGTFPFLVGEIRYLNAY
jgi:hypothetical protein